jgi:drug/metabolite transporter (DMT)-like permease
MVKITEHKIFKSELLLLLSAVIWGFAFVAQRAGMEFTGPFTFNALRFALGSLSLLPFILINRRKNSKDISGTDPSASKNYFKGGIILGSILFVASSFQQVGIVYTTAGNAGFITGFYVILVPIFGIFIGKKTHFNVWIGSALALAGMYLLSVKENLTVGYGDILVFFAAVFYALHVLTIGHYATKSDNLKISALQFAVCSIYSIIAAFLFETPELSGIIEAAIPILYGGVFSVGIAYTLQLIGQRKAHPAPAAIILSLEAVFAVFGGWLILNEVVTINTLAGCLLMLTGMILAQLNFVKKINLIKGNH